jgi:hypothetical protein
MATTIWRGTMGTEDPWAGIKTPSAIEGFAARRVDSDIEWDFYWAKGSDRRPRLLLHHAEPFGGQLPHLKGLELLEGSDGKSGRILDVSLSDPQLQDVFHRLCLDIVDSCRPAESEQSAVEIAVRRTWLWHRLLKGGADSRLSIDEQKGLLGEFVVLEELLGVLSAAQAVEAWMGPLDAPKDFEVGEVAIEAKARRGGATPFVTISSEYQLDPAGFSELFLSVVDLVRAVPSEGLSVADVAARIRARVADDNEAVLDLFEGRLLSAGLLVEHDYAEFRWLVTGRKAYKVGGEFPRIEPSGLPTGVERVRYQVDLVTVADFEVEPESMFDAIRSLGQHE